MRSNDLIVALFLVLMLSIMVGPASAADPVAEKIVWKRADFSAPSSRAVQMCDWFFQEISKRSGGRFVDQPYYNATLSPADQQPDALRNGLCQSTTWFASYYPAKAPLYNIASLPSLFPLTGERKAEYATFFAIMNEWVATPLISNEFKKWDAMPVGNIQAIHYALMGKSKIIGVKDLRGKKIRAVGGSADVLKGAGAVPVNVQVTEIYDALSKGVIQDICWSWRGFWPYKLYEVSSYYVSNLNLGHIPFELVVKKSAYDALPEDIKKIFQEVAREFPAYVSEQQEVDFKQALDVFRKANIEELNFLDNSELTDISHEIWKANIDKTEKRGINGKKAFNSLQTIMQRHISNYKPYGL